MRGIVSRQQRPAAHSSRRRCRPTVISITMPRIMIDHSYPLRFILRWKHALVFRLILCRENPDAVAGTSNRHANWEVVDPEKWVPDGYVCVRVDSRGAGRSPGYLCHNNARENRDFHDCIEWASVLSRPLDGPYYCERSGDLSNMKNPMRGCGAFTHDDPTDRPPELFGGKITLHFGPARRPSVLLPVIPPLSVRSQIL
ncbi:MAG: hypothetical protein HY525_17560 [Betaproteobacteria bacterium]|nr:hypothetical protein [Betaproteobacteria bacterium]